MGLDALITELVYCDSAFRGLIPLVLSEYVNETESWFQLKRKMHV